jgi:4-hydroxy-tetrahydrodipicolinate synthase
VLAPVLTPFASDYTPDVGRFLAHCHWLLANDVGLAAFGTNSEANSLSGVERMRLLERMIEGGVDPARVMPGTGCCSIAETAELTEHAVRLGCAGVLMLPPFYYKGVSDEGLFRSFAEVIDRVADDRLRVYLYHIPPVSQVGISLGLIERLLKSYPRIVAGIKDSSGDWNNTQAMLDAFTSDGFDVFVGSEKFLLANMRGGGRGAISATANVNPAQIASLHRGWRRADAEDLQARLDTVRDVFARYPMIAAMKQAIAYSRADDQWSRLRPPLTELSAAQGNSLREQLLAVGFEMSSSDSADRKTLVGAGERSGH